MFKHTLHGDEGLLTVTFSGTLSEEDFAELTTQVDAYLEDHDALQGLMIVTDEFPDWADFGALVSHFRFVRDHHERIRKVAFVSDNAELVALESLAEHFVDAQIKHFHHGQQEEAHEWLYQRD